MGNCRVGYIYNQYNISLWVYTFAEWGIYIINIISHLGGFDRVFPMDQLQTFSAYELKLLVCGEQTPNWTREDILNFTEPKYGYTKDRYAQLHVSINFSIRFVIAAASIYMITV